MWHQDTLGTRSMINCLIVSSDLQPYVLDAWVKRGTELSTDYHLGGSWIRYWGRMLDRCGVRLAQALVREIFNSLDSIA